MNHDISFTRAYEQLQILLDGTARREIAAACSRDGNVRESLMRLRGLLRSNSVPAGGRQINLEPFVGLYDRRTRTEGFHVLNDWDGKADRVNDDIIPVDVLHYVADQRGDDPPDPIVPAILLDYYFFHLLQLLSLRVWDEGDPDENLDLLSALLDLLQGPGGSGQRFVNRAETLLLIATSHYERLECGYGALLDRVKTLNATHQANVALGHAASMGSHLRFGFEATYGRDTVKMRDDNVADYPWLCFALLTVMREYARLHDAGIDGAYRTAVVEAMLNGLSPDARAFVGEPSKILSSCDADRAQFRALFLSYKHNLLAEFEPHRPTEQTYSPLSFFFNFSHNIIKGTVVDSLLRGRAWDVSFDDLIGGSTDEPARMADRKALAVTLMSYARLNPDRIGGRPMPVIVYDPQAGHQAFAVAMRKMRE